jgi:damage-control phosphatase, subfamily I
VKVSPHCVPCLLRRAIYETELVDGSRVPAVIRAACGVFSEHYSPSRVSARLATKVHREVYRVLGSRDPYIVIKRRSNKVASGLLPSAERMVARSRDPLRTAILCSIAGNILDFGIRTDIRRPEELAGRFSGIVRDGLAIDDTPRLRKLLKPGSKVVYFADNCGEIVLDKLVFRELRGLGCAVTLVVKGEPILTDATMEDVEELGLRKEVDAVLDTGSFAVGVDIDRMPPALSRAMRGRDLIISKGMANFESFSGTRWRPILHLMRTKCEPVASAAGAPLDVSIAKLWE